MTNWMNEITATRTNLGCLETYTVPAKSLAERSRIEREDRELVAAAVGYPIDCCATVGEMIQDLRRKRA
jgi:hypothetical protein